MSATVKKIKTVGFVDKLGIKISWFPIKKLEIGPIQLHENDHACLTIGLYTKIYFFIIAPLTRIFYVKVIFL